MRRKASPEEIEVLKAIAAFQWDWNVAFSLFPKDDEFSVDVRRGRVRHVILKGRVYLTLRPNDGLFSLSISAAERIISSTDSPRFRLVVKRDREIRGSILARDIVDIDPGLRPGDEVVIVDREDSLIGVGRLRVPVNMMEGLVYGEVARVRSRV